MPDRASLTIVIVAKNEAGNLIDCLASAAFADEVLVLDSGSSDGTPELAGRAGARVVSTDWPGYGPQQQRGIDMATSQWVLSLDADERIPAALREEIERTLAEPLHAGYRIPRLSELCGRFVHHGGWRPDYTLRLVRRELGGFSDHFLHAHMTVRGSVGDLRESLIHYSYPSVSSMLEKLDRYSSGHARDLHAKGRQGGLGRALLHAAWAFARTYVLRLGFLDGGRGLMLAIYNAEYTYYKYLKLMFLAHPPSRPSVGP